MKSPSGVKVLGSDLESSSNNTFLGMINIDFTKKEGVYRTVCAHALPNFVDLFEFRVHGCSHGMRNSERLLICYQGEKKEQQKVVG